MKYLLQNRDVSTAALYAQFCDTVTREMRSVSAHS
jgi:hypothetical protein